MKCFNWSDGHGLKYINKIAKHNTIGNEIINEINSQYWWSIKAKWTKSNTAKLGQQPFLQSQRIETEQSHENCFGINSGKTSSQWDIHI